MLRGNNSVQKLQEKNQRFYISTERFPQPTAITCYVQSEGYGKLSRILAEEKPLMAIFFQVGLDISRTLLIDGTSEARPNAVQMTMQPKNDVSGSFLFTVMIAT